MSFGYQVLGFGSSSAVIPDPYDIDFLVIAGGASGGAGAGANTAGAGGGAGGYRSSTQETNSGVAITITIGAGGKSSVNVIFQIKVCDKFLPKISISYVIPR